MLQFRVISIGQLGHLKKVFGSGAANLSFQLEFLAQWCLTAPYDGLIQNG